MIAYITSVIPAHNQCAHAVPTTWLAHLDRLKDLRSCWRGEDVARDICGEIVVSHEASKHWLMATAGKANGRNMVFAEGAQIGSVDHFVLRIVG